MIFCHVTLYVCALLMGYNCIWKNPLPIKDTKGTVKLINLKHTDNAKAKNEKHKQTTTHTTQHRKLKNKQHEPHQKTKGDLRCSGRVSRSCSTG